MSYIDQSSRPSASGIVAVIGVHAGIAAILVTGLTISGTVPEVITNIQAGNIPDEVPPPKPPPPPPERNADKAEQPATLPAVHTPNPPFEFDRTSNAIETTEVVPLPLPSFTPAPRQTLDLPKPTPSATFDPVGAKPRNDPTRWLSDRDYKSSWARRELTGVAKYRLQIAADGTIGKCTVTGSTGHAELDVATCQLISKRAKFEPARGSGGEPVAGTYNGSVMWTLPQ